MTKSITRISAATTIAVSTKTKALIADSTSANTRRAYSAALRALDAWADGAPITDAALADYLAHRHGEGASPATLRMAVAAVNFRARLQGAQSPAGALTKQTLAGAARQGADRGRGQAFGVDFSAADHMAHQAAKRGTRGGLRDCALILVTSDALLRVGEASALLVADINLGDGEGKGAHITIKRSKTDQTGEGATLYIRPRTAFAVRQWLQHAGITEGPLFRRMRKGGAVQGEALSPAGVREVIVAAANAAGVGEGGRVSGHSLRVGAAGDLAMRGATLPALQEAGRWKSPSMAAAYARQGLAQQGAVARLRPE